MDFEDQPEHDPHYNPLHDKLAGYRHAVEKAKDTYDSLEDRVSEADPNYLHHDFDVGHPSHSSIDYYPSNLPYHKPIYQHTKPSEPPPVHIGHDMFKTPPKLPTNIPAEMILAYQGKYGKGYDDYHKWEQEQLHKFKKANAELTKSVADAKEAAAKGDKFHMRYDRADQVRKICTNDPKLANMIISGYFGGARNRLRQKKPAERIWIMSKLRDIGINLRDK